METTRMILLNLLIEVENLSQMKNWHLQGFTAQAMYYIRNRKLKNELYFGR